jgi:hypothetical protein
MLFPDPLRALLEFHRVLRNDGRAAVSVNTVSERSFVSRIATSIGRHVPSKAATAAQYFSLGDPLRLHSLFEAAGFRDVETIVEARHHPFPSFDAYFEPIASGQGGVGTDYVSLPIEVQRAVKEEVRRELERASAPGSPIVVEVEVLYGSGRK